jgi:tetratricopeptide (TPR) repeat protein
MEANPSCPNCGKPIRRESQKFCRNCGFRLPVTEVKRPSLIIQAALPAPLVLERYAPQPSRTLREGFYELGVALATQGRRAEAAEALERALREDGPISPAAIYYEIAHNAEAANEFIRAFRAWLECARTSPGDLVSVLEYLNSRLDSEASATLGRWILNDWAEAATAVTDKSHLPELEFFLGRVHLFRAEYPKALDRFAKAARFSPAAAYTLAERFVFGAALPALAAVEGQTHFFLAQLYAVFNHKAEALRQADLALAAGLPESADLDPVALVQEFKAGLLQSQNQDEEAAEYFYEAGRRFYIRNENKRALKLLRKARKLRPGHAPTYWHLADLLRMEGGERRLLEACRIWGHAATKLGLPDEEFAWAYTVRALLNEQLVTETYPDPHSTWRLYSKAVAWLECGLLLDPEDPYIWTNLGRFLSYLNFDSNAAAATGQALKLDRNSVPALEAHAFTLIYLGDFEGAEDAIYQKAQLDPSESPDYSKLWIFVLQRKYDLAMKLLDPLIEKFPQGIDYLDLRASCRERSGHLDGARADWDHLLKVYGESKPPRPQPPDFAVCHAAYKLGHWLDAIDWFKQLRDVPIETEGRASLYLGLSEMAAGDWQDGPYHLSQGVRETEAAWVLAEFLEFDFHPFRVTGERLETDRAILRELEVQVHRRIEDLSQRPPNPIQELRNRLERLELSGRLDSLDAVVVRAILARQYAMTDRFYESGLFYRELLRHPADFPEASRGVTIALGHLSDSAAARLRAEQVCGALEDCLLPGKRLALETGAAELIPDFTAQIALARFMQGDRVDAHKGFATALDERRKADPTGGGRWLGELCSAALGNGLRYWALLDFWESAGLLAVDEPLQHDLSSAGDALSGFLPAHVGLSLSKGSLSQFSWIVRPVVVELDARLVPEDIRNWTLLRQYIPEMQDRILATTGVESPGLHIRDNSATVHPGAYAFLLDEVPVIRGILERSAAGRAQNATASNVAESPPGGNDAWMRFSPRPIDTVLAAGLPPEGLVPGVHPITGEEGCWIAQPFWAQSETQGVELWPEPISYLVQHLEGFLRRNLASFLSVEAVSRWLEKAARTLPDLVKSAVPDAAARLALCRLQRALVQEDVPILDAAVILEEFAGTQRETDLSLTIAAVRKRLKAQLPGNQRDVMRIPLPPDIEAKLALAVTGSGSRRCLALSEDDTDRILAELRPLLLRDGSGQALVVKDANLRRFVRQFVQSGWADVPILAVDELLQPSEVIRA